MTDMPDDSKIGALLLNAELLDKNELKRALLLSRYTGLPSGRCMVLLEGVSDTTVKAAILLQSLVRDGLIDTRTARAALTIMSKQKWDLSRAFKALGIDSSMVSRNRLGELLTESRLLSMEELKLALYINDHSSLPTGYTIGLLGKCSPTRLKFALSMQREIRARKIGREEGIKNLAALRNRNFKGDYPANALFKPLGNMLVDAGLISRHELAQTTDTAIKYERMIALLLIENRHLTKELLIALIKSRELLLTGIITRETALSLIARCHRVIGQMETSSIEKKRECDKGSISLNLEGFLKATGFLESTRSQLIIEEIMKQPELTASVLGHLINTRKISYRDSKQAINSVFNNDQVLTQLLQGCRSLNRDIVDSAIVIYKLYSEGRLDLQQAAVNFTIQEEIRARGNNHLTQTS